MSVKYTETMALIK